MRNDEIAQDYFSWVLSNIKRNSPKLKFSKNKDCWVFSFYPFEECAVQKVEFNKDCDLYEEILKIFPKIVFFSLSNSFMNLCLHSSFTRCIPIKKDTIIAKIFGKKSLRGSKLGSHKEKKFTFDSSLAPMHLIVKAASEYDLNYFDEFFDVFCDKYALKLGVSKDILLGTKYLCNQAFDFFYHSMLDFQS